MKVFEPFRLDTVNQCLWRSAERISLAPKTFSVLQYLVDHPEVLRTYILELRKVLGDRANEPRFIRTFPKRGYQFLALVADDSSPSPTLSPAPPMPPVDAEPGPVGREAPIA